MNILFGLWIRQNKYFQDSTWLWLAFFLYWSNKHLVKSVPDSNRLFSAACVPKYRFIPLKVLKQRTDRSDNMLLLLFRKLNSENSRKFAFCLSTYWFNQLVAALFWLLLQFFFKHIFSLPENLHCCRPTTWLAADSYTDHLPYTGTTSGKNHFRLIKRKQQESSSVC